MKMNTALLCGIGLLISVLTVGCGSGQSDQTPVATASPAATEAAEVSEAPMATDADENDGMNGGTLDDGDDTNAGETSAKPGAADDGQLTDGDNTSEPSDGSSDTSSSKKISKEKAAKIALERVKGAKESDVSIHSEWDDGKEIYEGSIFYEGKEYDFEIDAVSGKILEWEVEVFEED